MSLKELGLFFGVFVAWIVLSRWVLPFFGVNTCMSSGCSVRPSTAVTDEVPSAADEKGEVQ